MECSIRARRPLESRKELENGCHHGNALRPRSAVIRSFAGGGGVYVAGIRMGRQNFPKGGRFFSICRLHWWIALRTEGRRRQTFWNQADDQRNN